VEVLASGRGPGFPIHYRDWYDLLVRAGHRVQGRDPLATFLAQVARSPVIRSAAPNRGVYILDIDGAVERATAELREAELRLVRAQAELSATRTGRRRDARLGTLASLEESLILARREHSAKSRLAREVAQMQELVRRVRVEGARVA
jgi:hypothetical protein